MPLHDRFFQSFRGLHRHESVQILTYPAPHTSSLYGERRPSFVGPPPLGCTHISNISDDRENHKSVFSERCSASFRSLSRILFDKFVVLRGMGRVHLNEETVGPALHVTAGKQCGQFLEFRLEEHVQSKGAGKLPI